MSKEKALICVLISFAITLLLRALPFLVFRGKKPVPGWVKYLGNVLPAGIMAILVVYCLKSVPADLTGSGWKQLAGVAVTAGVHLWKKNTILSMIAGTAVYMILLAV